MRTESRQMPDYVHYVISGTDNAFEQTIHCYSITAKKCFAQQNAASHLVVNSSWSMGYGRLCLDISAFALGYVTKVSRCVCLRFGCADNRWSLVKQRPEKTECIRRMSGLSANNPSCWLSLRQPLYLFEHSDGNGNYGRDGSGQDFNMAPQPVRRNSGLKVGLIIALVVIGLSHQSDSYIHIFSVV